MFDKQGHPLIVGDVFRLGRMEYRVLEIKDANVMDSLLTVDPYRKVPFQITIKRNDQENSEQKQENEVQNSASDLCRICLDDNKEEDFIEPCLKCKGSTGKVHLTCLSKWLSSKMTDLDETISGGFRCHFLKKLECEVCKTPWPDLIEMPKTKQILPLIPTSYYDQLYILVERVPFIQAGESTKSRVYLEFIQFDEVVKLKQGRGADCHFKENDISVSRFHASIKYNQGNSRFYIMDNKSKFGTLVLMREDIKLNEKRIYIQVGNVVVSMLVKHKRQIKENINQRIKPINPTKKALPPPRLDTNSDPFFLNSVFIDQSRNSFGSLIMS